MTQAAASSHRGPAAASTPAAVRSLRLADFRNYPRAGLSCGPEPVVLLGPNGAGKTNLLEALSLLSPGRGLRRAALKDIDRDGGGPWRLEALVEAGGEAIEVATGREAGRESGIDRRWIKLFGEPVRGQQVLAETLGVVWLTPAMDRLFVEGASGRRRFVDRLALAVFPDHARAASAYEKALRERAALLRQSGSACGRDPAWLGALERRMAEPAVALAAARRELVLGLNALLQPGIGALPRVRLELAGEVEAMLGGASALQVEDELLRRWRAEREVDAATGGAATGPHRSDLGVFDAGTGESAARCSTGRQKSLLLAITLAEAELRRALVGEPPLLLLDEVAAHLDFERREMLATSLAGMGAQAWLTGTDRSLFSGLEGRARFVHVEEGRLQAHE